MDEAAEGMLPDDFLTHADVDAIDGRSVDAIARLVVASCGPLKNFERRCGVSRDARVCQRIEGVGEQKPAGTGGRTDRTHGRMAELVPVVEHWTPPVCFLE